MEERKWAVGNRLENACHGRRSTGEYPGKGTVQNVLRKTILRQPCVLSFLKLLGQSGTVYTKYAKYAKYTKFYFKIIFKHAVFTVL